MPFDLTLTDEEHAVLVRAVRKVLDDDRYPRQAFAAGCTRCEGDPAKWLDRGLYEAPTTLLVRPGTGLMRGQGRRRR